MLSYSTGLVLKAGNVDFLEGVRWSDERLSVHWDLFVMKFWVVLVRGSGEHHRLYQKGAC